VYSCLFTFESAAASYTPYKGTRLIEATDLAPVLQYGSGLSSDFLAKILRVDTPLFLWNMQFCFTVSPLLVYKSHESRCTYVVHDTSFGSSVFAYGVGSWGSIPNEVIFLITMSVMALEARNIHLLFKFLHLFIKCYGLQSFYRYGD
jgi:hypothetical protein